MKKIVLLMFLGVVVAGGVCAMKKDEDFFAKSIEEHVFCHIEKSEDCKLLEKMLKSEENLANNKWKGVPFIVKVAKRSSTFVEHSDDAMGTAFTGVPFTKVLLKYGADINAKETETGYTALYYAVTKGDFDLVSFLLKNGANPNIEYGKAGTVLDRVLMKIVVNEIYVEMRLEFAEILQLLIKHMSDKSKLINKSLKAYIDLEVKTRNRKFKVLENQLSSIDRWCQPEETKREIDITYKIERTLRQCLV